MESNTKMDKLTKSGNIKPGQILNPHGRPVGSQTKAKSNDIKTRLLAKHKIHPADKLVMLAHYFEAANKYEEAAKIWMLLLKYCESPKKVAVIKEEPEIPTSLSSELTDKILEEFENNESNSVKSDKGNGMAERSVTIPPEASPKEDLSGHTGE